MNIQVNKLQPADLDKFQELIRLFEDVFRMQNFRMPDERYLQQLLEREDFFVFVALSDNRVVGGLTAYTMMQYYSTMPLVYIFDLAVATELQRKGIGKMLISTITDYCSEKGVQEVFVQADEIDDYALDFYRATGATSERVVHFTYSLNTNSAE